jgi:hypothetical protein
MRLWPRLDAGDPQAQAAAAIAMLIAASQPFYPVYCQVVAGVAAWPAWLILLTTPGYIAIAAAAPRRGRLARVMLPLVGVANTAIAVKALGPASGVELFYLPCALLAAALSKPGDRVLAALALGATLLAYLVGGRWLAPPVAPLSPDALAAMVRLHAMSVGGLLVYIGYRLRPVGSCLRQ